MRLRLPPGLQYPITVTELLKTRSDDVAVNELLFRYDFRTTKEEDDYLGETRTVEKVFPSIFESEVEGTFSSWLIEVGQVIRGPLDVAEIEEPCTHEVQFHGICAICGRDMTQLNYNRRNQDTDRAGINMMHDDSNLKISTKEASRSEEEAKRRLIATKRLSLVVDLDQTIIHATVDPTVGEWQNDPENPNHAAVADVKAFQLTDDGPGSRTCWYYIKTRPGLQEFLSQISKLYELHIYTMGTRAYAKEIAKIVDPTRSIFGDRILSRDESGSLTAKNLQRLFPIDTKMVVIIDDRGDVWKWNDNLVKVTPYDFFVGIGDINSSFLPQKPQIQASPKEQTDTPEVKVNGSANGTSHSGDDSTLDQLVSMGGGDDPEKLKDQTEKAAQAIDTQLEERPLLQKQKALDKADEENSSHATSSIESNSIEKSRHHLLEDHDIELFYLEQSLTQVHAEFYAEYESRMAQENASQSHPQRPKIEISHEKAEENVERYRLAQEKGSSTLTADKGQAASGEAQGEEEHETSKAADKKSPEVSAPSTVNLEILPDIKDIMPGIKRRVLDGVSLVFSGVVPLGIDVQGSDIAIWATSFGAIVKPEITKRTTHVVAARKGTIKVKQALRAGRGRIKVVRTQWLMDSIIRWRRQAEGLYLLHSEDEEPLPSDTVTVLEDGDDILLSGSDESTGDELGLTDGDTTDVEQEGHRAKIKLRLKTGGHRSPDDQRDRLGEADDSNIDVSFNSPFDENSPIGNDADWKDMDDEVAEFMGDLGDLSDSDSEAETIGGTQTSEPGASNEGDRSKGVTSAVPKKRKSEDGDETEDRDRSPPRKKARDTTENDSAGQEDDDGFEEDFEAAWDEDT